MRMYQPNAVLNTELAVLVLTLVLALALGIDLIFGEPPTRFHPVGWMGRYLSWMRRQNKPQRAFLRGLSLLMLGLVLVGCLTSFLLVVIAGLPIWLETLMLALFLKPMLSLRALLQAGESVKQALLLGDLDEARSLLSWHLVSRDTADLSESEVAGATVESLAENLTDSLVAPIFYFALFGLTGAVLYRFINTADAMLGYRTQELEYFGKFAARLDDILNFVPARITATLLGLALYSQGCSAYRGFRVALASQALLPSPNAGWTMATVAGGLNLRLDKRGVYSLNPTGRAPQMIDITKMQRLILSVTVLSLLVILGFERA